MQRLSPHCDKTYSKYPALYSYVYQKIKPEADEQPLHIPAAISLNYSSPNSETLWVYIL